MVCVHQPCCKRLVSVITTPHSLTGWWWTRLESFVSLKALQQVVVVNGAPALRPHLHTDAIYHLRLHQPPPPSTLTPHQHSQYTYIQFCTLGLLLYIQWNQTRLILFFSPFHCNVICVGPLNLFAATSITWANLDRLARRFQGKCFSYKQSRPSSVIQIFSKESVSIFGVLS